MKKTGNNMTEAEIAEQVKRYDRGELEDYEVINLFQALIDEGFVWRMPFHYGRTALSLLSDGLCTRNSNSMANSKAGMT